MSHYEALEILEYLRSKDKTFFEEMSKEHGAATFCAVCKQNTHAGLHPFYHQYRRSLCDKCRPRYTALLEALQEYAGR